MNRSAEMFKYATNIASEGRMFVDKRASSLLTSELLHTNKAKALTGAPDYYPGYLLII